MSLFDLLRSAIGGVDGVNRLVAAEVTARLAKYPEDYRLTTREGRAIMRDVRSIVSTAYGSTQGRSMSSPIFREITKHTDLAAEMAFQDMFSELKTSMQNVDPDLYDEFRRGMYEGGFGEEDKLAEAFMSLNGPQAERQRFLRSGLMDPQRRWVDPAGYRLSDRVWKAGQRQRKAIDRVIAQGIRKGTGPVTLAGELNRYLNPDFAPVKYDPNGRVTRRNRRPSGATSARVLARTELQRVHHDATVDAVARLEVHRVGVKWALSAAHPKIDICDSYAKGSSPGFPPGVYWPDEVPSLPHPQCLCNLQPWVPSSEDVVREIADRHTGNAQLSGSSRPQMERYLHEVMDDPGSFDFDDMFIPLNDMIGPQAVFALPNSSAQQVYWDMIQYRQEARAWAVRQKFTDLWARAGYDLQISDGVAWPPQYFGMVSGQGMMPNELFRLLETLTYSIADRERRGMWTATEWHIHDGDPRGRQERGWIAWVHGRGPLTMRPNTGAQMDRIYINASSPAWQEGASYDDLVPNGDFHAVPSSLGTVDHEHGHLLHFANIDDLGVWYDADRHAFVDANGIYRTGDSGDWFDDYEKDIAGMVSTYAQESVDEFVAEVYTLVAQSATINDEVLDLYRSFYGPAESGGVLPFDWDPDKWRP